MKHLCKPKTQCMKTLKLYFISLTVVMLFIFSQQASSQLVNFYGSTGYINTINTAYSNSLLVKDVKKKNAGPEVIQPDSSNQSQAQIIPEYRRYPAVQFKPTGTRLKLQEYLDAVQVSPEQKAELKIRIEIIFDLYEEEAVRKGYPNDWALALVSYIGLNSHVYYGKTEKPAISFEQNVGLRDAVAESATANGIFDTITDKQKQELYELLIIGGCLTYHYYENARKENNTGELREMKLAAAQNLKVVGIKTDENN